MIIFIVVVIVIILNNLYYAVGGLYVSEGSMYFWESKYFEIYGPGGTKKGGPNLS